MEKTDTNLLDYMSKVYMICDNFDTILLLTEVNFGILKKNPTINSNVKLIVDNTTAMLFQLSVGYLYNLIEVIEFLKCNSHCDDLFKSNKIYDEFESNDRLIRELRNNITFHGIISGDNFRGLQQILTDCKISRAEAFKKIWISLRCGSKLTNQILNEFNNMSLVKKTVSKMFQFDEIIDTTKNYFDAQNEFCELSK